ncbi:MAG: UDP-N-acetylmuramate--L-alanine ligase [Buchnera aphidicola (Chaetogeoica yunlongensis)]
MKNISHIHLIGIGGSSMGGIAEILFKKNFTITGSDIISNNITKKLSNLGIKIFSTHQKKNIQNANLIVVSSAIQPNNPEIIAANNSKIPIMLRAELISKIIYSKYNIIIAGTHGKTSTTAMIFNIFEENKLYPTLINGGYVKSINNNVKIGKNPFYCILEADESDASFLYFTPNISVITNIDKDHIEKYKKNFNNLKSAFIKFIHNLPINGTAILCLDDNTIQSIIPHIKRKIITYGFNKNADLRINNYQQKKFTSTFIVIRKNKPILKINLNAPGKFNALNATASIAVAIQEHISDKIILKSLKNFQGVNRRFESHGVFKIPLKLHKQGKFLLINDYGHHPTEILESIHTARTGWPNKKLIMIFQPHRYTRTKTFKKEFSHVLSNVDELFLLQVYPANELESYGSNSFSLYKEIKKNKNISATLIIDLNTLFKKVTSKLSGNDLILAQGAGNIDDIIEKFIIQKL